MIRTRKIWQDGDIEYLIKHYPNIPAKCLAKKMNRSISSVHGQAHKLKIKKSENFKESAWSHIIVPGTKTGVSYRFPKGNIPQNKGKKMSSEQYLKSAPTMFKKGLEPTNTKYDGHERIDKEGYVLIRIQKGKYVSKSRYIWEQVNGPIPKGMVLVFKDKNKLNVHIENLELITNEENMIRNSIQRYPTELKQVIRLVSKVKKIVEKKDLKK